MTLLIAIAVIVGLAALILMIVGTLVSRLYHKVPQGQALIVSKTKTIDVTFTGALVVPVVQRAEMMDIGVKVIEIEKSGTDGLICRDNIRADIRVSFYVRVNKTHEDVVKVAQLVGCDSASDQLKLEELFSAKFAESLKTAGKQMDFVELYDKRETFRTNVIRVIGEDLNGYILDDVAIEYLEQTPVTSLDPANVLDAEGIRKITDITTRESIQANHFRREAEKQIKAKDVETQQAIFEMDRQEKAAEYRAQREMATTKAREESVTVQVEAEERLKAEGARLKADETIGVQQQNLQREVSVAEQNRLRVLAVEKEKIEKARQLEVVSREVETLAASKDVETEKARVADLAKARIASEKTVAEQEEAIATLRRVEDANREREAAVIAAGALAEAAQITTIKEAEAKERAAQHAARERLTLAEAGKSAAELEAAAKIRIADGVRAEAAAEGLAEVEVRKAEASAIAEVGLAQARVKEADAAAERAKGEAAADVSRLAGIAEGAATQAKLEGEAAGLHQKAAAMKELEGVGKEYDLAVRQLELDRDVQLASVDANKELGKAQAEAVGLALANADIDIVGGTDLFVDRLVGAVANGKTVSGFLNSSPDVAAVAKPYTNGQKDILELAAGTLAGVGADGLAKLSLAQLLHNLAAQVGGDEANVLRSLVGALQSKGLTDVELSKLLAK